MYGATVDQQATWYIPGSQATDKPLITETEWLAAVKRIAAEHNSTVIIDQTTRTMEFITPDRETDLKLAMVITTMAGGYGIEV